MYKLLQTPTDTLRANFLGPSLFLGILNKLITFQAKQLKILHNLLSIR